MPESSVRRLPGDLGQAGRRRTVHLPDRQNSGEEQPSSDRCQTDGLIHTPAAPPDLSRSACRRCSGSRLHHGDFTAVGIGDVVEAKKLPRTPTNQHASALVEHGFDLDIIRRESRGNAEESIAGFLGWEASDGPQTEFGWLDVLWRLTDVHGGALSGCDSN